MSYTLVKNLTTINYTAGNNRTIRYIVIHYTGNTTDIARANSNYFKSINRGASAHYFVDGTTVYQVVEDKNIAWAVGRNFGSNNLFGIVTNANSISIEMCGTNGAVSDATFQNTVILTKALMKLYNIPVANVYRHYDVCTKQCPGWTGWGTKAGDTGVLWNKFKSAITSSSTNSMTNNTNTQNTITTNLKYSVGTYVNVSSFYTSSTDPVSKAKIGNKSGTIIKTYPGRHNPYAVGTGSTIHFFCNDGDIRSTGKSTSTSTTNTVNKPDIIYKVYSKKWLDEVKNNTDYAGLENKAITGVMIKLSNGDKIKYRVHVIGRGWYDWVNGYNTNDFNNGYAGDLKNNIDAIEIKCDKWDIRYKVSTTSNGTAYYSEVADGQNDYAGVFGRPIDKLMCRIV